ncbi:MAG: RpiB/LacA/LacB family sugar-phosphate isomerase [Candidatus Faecimonas sp.]|nr:RpiB/LacA/LacB family sugar-phosphate isomerase [Mycoplasmatota bacterium]MDY2908222.1 RpiB/LacA/LacB family sugar-phosphate isomerase [Candidatus Faecimonas sp.]
MLKIGIASDHRGYTLKEQLIDRLMEEYDITDCGTTSTESVDYPDYAFKLGNLVADKDVDFGIAICGTGIGISIACNKVKGIRCAKVDTLEEAIATRVDNDSNIIAFGENMPLEKALELIKTFIKTNASNEEKHVRRRQKISEYEDR